MLKLQRIAPLLIAGLAAGCGDFEEPSRIIDLRTIAIASPVPEIRVDPTQLDRPLYVTLNALIFDPTGDGRPVTYEVLACPRALDTVTAATGRAGANCKPYDPNSTDADRSVPVTPPDAPPSTLPGAGPEHQIDIAAYELPREMLLRLVLGVEGPEPMGPVDPFARLGFPSSVIFQFTFSAGGERETAIKRMVLAVPPDGHPDQTPNANPQITGVRRYIERDDEGMAVDPQDWPADQPLAVPLGSSVWIEPQGAIAENYFTPVLTREAMPRIVVEEVPRETLRFTFLTNKGQFAPLGTGSEPSPVFDPSERIHLESKYTAPPVMPPDPNVAVWITVRDERGGASWIRRNLLLVSPE